MKWIVATWGIVGATIVALNCSSPQKIIQGAGDVLTVLACVDQELAKGSAPQTVVLTCGLKDEAQLEDLLKLSGVLSKRVSPKDAGGQ